MPIVLYLSPNPLVENSFVADEDDMPEIEFSSIQFSFYKKSILGYIAGFIVREIFNRISCNRCIDALKYTPLTIENDHSYSNYVNPSLSLIISKNRGGLINSFSSVFKIIWKTENCIKSIINSPSKLVKNKILFSVTHFLGNVFPRLDEHDKESFFFLITIQLK